MGTNYYLESKPCPHCGRGGETRHIGKSSAGWVFALHVYPNDGINDLFDWRELFNSDETVTRDEHGNTISRHDMLARIMCHLGDPKLHRKSEYMGEGTWFDARYGLWRSGKHENGAGPWDYHEGDFS